MTIPEVIEYLKGPCSGVGMTTAELTVSVMLEDPVTLSTRFERSYRSQTSILAAEYVSFLRL